MPGIPRELAEHALHVDPDVRQSGKQCDASPSHIVKLSEKKSID